jgi:hypothetical protein
MQQAIRAGRFQQSTEICRRTTLLINLAHFGLGRNVLDNLMALLAEASSAEATFTLLSSESRS